ncbi:MAG TPA: hypothetical protein VKN18_22860 [Blastocatellia bacterium]|nr:hypothetical protein [Blastocatellia bacterium]
MTLREIQNNGLMSESGSHRAEAWSLERKARIEVCLSIPGLAGKDALAHIQEELSKTEVRGSDHTYPILRTLHWVVP